MQLFTSNSAPVHRAHPAITSVVPMRCFVPTGGLGSRISGAATMPTKKPPLFRRRRQVERYFGGKTIKCLLCGGRFGRLSFHLAAKHGVTTDEYKSRFGLPWSRGLTSAQSRANSGWNKARKAKASRLARRTQFFKLAHRAPRREAPLFLKLETAKNLSANAAGFGKLFESRVRVLFGRGLTDTAIAQTLNVARTTVNQRTKRWRKPNRTVIRRPRLPNRRIIIQSKGRKR